MITLQSKLENSEQYYAQFRTALEPLGFHLGGNWDYEHGYFDKALDDENKVWLRLPFIAVNGDFDEQSRDIYIRLGKPFILNHLYQDNNDEASMSPLGSLVNQFQEPVDVDAPVDEEWIDQGVRELRKAEKAVFAPMNI